MTENAVSTTPGSRLSALARKLWFPFFLLLLTILTYGLLTFRQGFYLDDWYIILFKGKLGNQGFMLYFSQDRPFLSYPYVLLMAVFGESAVNWAIFALVLAAVEQTFPRPKEALDLGDCALRGLPGFPLPLVRDYVCLRLHLPDLLFALVFCHGEGP